MHVAAKNVLNGLKIAVLIERFVNIAYVHVQRPKFFHNLISDGPIAYRRLLQANVNKHMTAIKAMAKEVELTNASSPTVKKAVLKGE